MSAHKGVGGFIKLCNTTFFDHCSSMAHHGKGENCYVKLENIGHVFLCICPAVAD